jgi:hypothetical protein
MMMRVKPIAVSQCINPGGEGIKEGSPLLPLPEREREHGNKGPPNFTNLAVWSF